MKTQNLRSVLISGSIAYIIGVSAFLGSFFVPILSNPEVQANLVLAIVIVPAAMLGALFYYRKGHQTHGLILGLFMFLIAMILDALITVPLFVIPAGGDHISFFTDPFFWFIGLEYVLAVFFYWRIQKNNKTKIARSTFYNRSDSNSSFPI